MKRIAAVLAGMMLVAGVGTAAPAAADRPGPPSTCEELLAFRIAEVDVVRDAYVQSSVALANMTAERDALAATLTVVQAEKAALVASNARKQARIERLREKLAAR